MKQDDTLTSEDDHTQRIFEPQDWTLRDGVRGDWPFVIDSWLRCYAGSRWASLWDADRRRYYDAHRRLITSLLERDRCAVCVAHALLEPDAILGYAVGEPEREGELRTGCLHFYYVKAPFRRAGVGKSLLQALGRVVGPLRATTSEIRRGDAQANGLVYRPELLWER